MDGRNTDEEKNEHKWTTMCTEITKKENNLDKTVLHICIEKGNNCLWRIYILWFSLLLLLLFLFMILLHGPMLAAAAAASSSSVIIAVEIGIGLFYYAIYFSLSWSKLQSTRVSVCMYGKRSAME